MSLTTTEDVGNFLSYDLRRSSGFGYGPQEKMLSVGKNVYVTNDTYPQSSGVGIDRLRAGIYEQNRGTASITTTVVGTSSHKRGPRYIFPYDKKDVESLDLNTIRLPQVPYQGRGFYSDKVEPSYDDCYLNVQSAVMSSQKSCMKLDNHVEGIPPLRQNGSKNLPDHFSRFGYNQDTGTCRNGYCLGNHNGRYIVGENEVASGPYAEPQGLAPLSWYVKNERSFYLSDK